MNRPKYREKYRQYALKGGKVPRSTLHSRRKRQEEERKKREVQNMFPTQMAPSRHENRITFFISFQAEEAQKAITFQEESQTICGQQQLERVRQMRQYS